MQTCQTRKQRSSIDDFFSWKAHKLNDKMVDTKINEQHLSQSVHSYTRETSNWYLQYQKDVKTELRLFRLKC